jgi:outer membrane protein assembly factor BamA
LKDKQFTCLLLLTFWLLGCSTLIQATARGNNPAEEKRLRIAAIGIQGNEKTRDQYILLELTFAAGDSVTIPELEDKVSVSLTNLVNTSLFLNHLIRIDWFYISDDDLVVNITLKERWYLWPEPILQNAQRNFNTWLQDKNVHDLNYGINLIRENFRGRNERLSMVLQLGFDERVEFTYHDPALKGSKTLGFSFGAGFARNREVPFTTSSNALMFYRDDSYLLKKTYAFGQCNFRPSMRHFHTLKLLISRFQVDDTLLSFNPEYIASTDMDFLKADLIYMLKIDHRNHKAYPLTGYYVDFEFKQHNLATTKPGNGSFGTIQTNLRRYWQLQHDFYYGIGATLKVSSTKRQPFLFEQGLGYGRAFVRGYEYNVIHGAHHFLLKQNLKYALISPRMFHIAVMPHEKFRDAWLAVYINLFADAGYVSGIRSDGNDLVNRWIGGTGIGLDFVTYYDKVIRLEATLNDQGKVGVFAHFVAPI